SRKKRKNEAHKAGSSNLQMRTDEIVRNEIPVKEIFSRLILSLKSKGDVEQARIERLAQIRRNLILKYKRSLLERRRSPRIAKALLLQEKLRCDGLIDVPIAYSPSGLGSLFDVPVATASNRILR
ncbi:hypothetical protein MKX03_026400, partial [Papaver bracteatum]